MWYLPHLELVVTNYIPKLNEILWSMSYVTQVTGPKCTEKREQSSLSLNVGKREDRPLQMGQDRFK